MTHQSMCAACGFGAAMDGELVKIAEDAESRLEQTTVALEGIERHMRQYVGRDLAGSMIRHWADRLAALRTPEATP